MQARRGELMDALEGQGLVAEQDGRGAGLITWLVDPSGERAEIRAVAVAPESRGRGLGRTLLEAAHARLAGAGARFAWLVTTNDNAPALRLYESAGYRITVVRAGAVDEARRTLKPTIPSRNEDGTPIRDELELEIDLADGSAPQRAP